MGVGFSKPLAESVANNVLGEPKLFESGQCIYLSGRQTLSPEQQDAVPVSSGVKNPLNWELVG